MWQELSTFMRCLFDWETKKLFLPSISSTSWSTKPAHPQNSKRDRLSRKNSLSRNEKVHSQKCGKKLLSYRRILFAYFYIFQRDPENREWDFKKPQLGWLQWWASKIVCSWGQGSKVVWPFCVLFLNTVFTCYDKHSYVPSVIKPAQKNILTRLKLHLSWKWE